MIVTLMLLALAAYLAGGMAFSIPFVLRGVNRIDLHAARGSWGFRVLILPGTVLLWPFLAHRWMSGVAQPPEERNAHRCAAKRRGNTP